MIQTSKVQDLMVSFQFIFPWMNAIEKAVLSVFLQKNSLGPLEFKVSPFQ